MFNGKEIAVVLSTYNGEKYLKNQMISLRDQTVKPDIVYICDDCSTDGTVNVINDFIHDNKLAGSWILSINEKNIGWKRNFHKIIRETKENLIFLCDQDDVWNIEKIEMMAELINENPEVGLLASSYTPLYNEEPRFVSPAVLRTMKYDGKLKKVRMDPTFHIVMRPGCTYVLRKSFFLMIEDVWFDDIPHDMNLWTMAVLMNKAYYIDKSLIQWRRYHNSSSSPVREKITHGENALRLQYEETISDIDERISYYNRLIEYQKKNRVLNEEYKNYIEEEKNRCEHLKQSYMDKSITEALATYIKYRKSYLSIRSVLSDVKQVSKYKRL